MGVQGLWKLLESTGRPVSLESLEGKVLAVDVSLWLHQAMRGMRDEGGQMAANAHLHVLFQRVCKLLFYRIRPVFVFDGSVPELKRQTTVARRQRREIATGHSKRAAERILKNYLQSHALHAVMGGAGGATTAAPRLQRAPSDNPDMYELPPLPPSVSQDSSDSESDAGGPTLGPDYLGRYQNLDEVDITSDSFQSLPPEIQHEVLQEMRAAKKRNSWKTMDRLPKESADFSEYQVQNLLLKGRMSKRMEVLQREMSERHAGQAAVDLLASGPGQAAASVEAGRIASEDTHHYLLVKRPSVKPASDSDGDADIDDPTNADRPQAVRSPALAGGQEPEVKGQAPVTSSGRSLSPSATPWEPDVIVIDSEEEEVDSCRELEIASVVRRFFSRRVDDGSAAATAVSAEEVVVCLDHGEAKGQGLDCDVEIIQAETRGSGSSLEEVVILDEERMDPPHGEPRAAAPAQGLDKAAAEVNLAPEVETRLEDLSEDPTVQKREAEPPATGASNDFPPTKPELPRPSEVELAPPPIFSLDDEEEEEEGEEAQGREAPSPLRKSEEDAEETSSRILQVSDWSSDEDDFVEVLDQPGSQSQPDELFPVGALPPSVDLGEAAPSTASLREGESGAQLGAGESDGSASGEEAEEGEEDLARYREDARKEWQAMDVSDASQLQESLAAQRQVLQLERGRQDRVAASITDVMYAESKELLELFGLPYVVSPEEAEAQCAHLDRTDQTQGTITDDSDVWLFGARRVYKNLFSRGRDVEFYKSSDLEQQLFLDRDKLIVLAMLLGSDYTEGVKGVGWVTAMEVLAEFPGKGVEPLQTLKAWWQEAREQLLPPVESQLKSKLRKLSLQESFPCPRVYQAYWSPAVDESEEKFSWQSPDLGLLRDFAKDKLGWTRTKADEVLLPVMKKLNEKSMQRRITSFLHADVSQPRPVTSKRLKRVLKNLARPQGGGGGDEVEDEGEADRKGGGRKRGRKARRKAVATETVAGKRRNGRRGGTRKEEPSEDAISAATDSHDDEASQVGMQRDGYIASGRGDEEEEEGEDEEDEESSEEEFVISKRTRLEVEAPVSPSARLQRKQRRQLPHRPVDPPEKEPAPLAEFLEIEESVSRKTEGRTPIRKGGETQIHPDQLPTAEEKNDSPKRTALGQAAATALPKGRGRARKGKGQGGKGHGLKVKGQSRRGGTAESRGVGSCRQAAGPMLSESSSSDSED